MIPHRRWTGRWCAFTAMVLGPAISCGPAPGPTIREFGPAEVARGRVFYDTNGCAACHGRDGRGDGQLAATLTPPPRDFRRADAFKRPRTIAAVADAIARGIPALPKPMPAFPHLDLETRQLMAAYVLSIGGTSRITAPLEEP